VQICKARCSRARAGFHKHLVFSTMYKPEASAGVRYGYELRQIQQFVLLLSGPGRKTAAAGRSSALPTNFPQNHSL